MVTELTDPPKTQFFFFGSSKQGARHLGDLTINSSQSSVFWGSTDAPKSDVHQLVPLHGAVEQVYLLQTRQLVLGFHRNCHDLEKNIGIFGSSPPFKWWFVHMLNYMSMRINRPGSIYPICMPFYPHYIPPKWYS